MSSRFTPSPSKGYNTRSSRSTSSRRPRFLSRSICVLLLIAIFFWTQSSQPEAHVYSPDGLLHVNSEGKHPILELIERSESQWKRKLERQSKTLKQAVDVYKRRYKRAPPKGFDIWWEYVTSHDVQLVDEYDSIHARLQPFWGVAPSVLRATQAVWESHPDTFTIGKHPGASKVELLNHTLPPDSGSAFQRVENQLNLLKDVQEYLPEFRATFTMHDGPQHMMTWEMRRQAEEAAARGEYIDVRRVAASIKTGGWAAACPPNTPIQSYVPPPIPTPPLDPAISPLSPPAPCKTKSFIYDHHLSMSPCLHPTHILLNGYLSQYHYPRQFGPSPKLDFIPTFSICVSPLNSDILAVAPEQYTAKVTLDPAWRDKPDERLLWRGSNTGTLHKAGNWWNVSQRVRLVELTTRRGSETRVLLPRRAGGVRGAAPGGRWDSVVGNGESVRTGVLNAAFMDVGFVGRPIQCRGNVCEDLRRMFEWRGYQSSQAAWVYKYIMDIDGNGWSARFKRLMTSNSLIFKSTIFPEWYTERIMPWVHYVPVQVDLSDVYDILAFFRGDLTGAGGHDHLAERIATAGKTWSHEFYRWEDMTAYQFRLFLEYARVMSLDRAAMSYDAGDEDSG